MTDHNILENVILAKLREYPDGLSVDHLQSALELSDAHDIVTALAKLLREQRVIQGGNGWWYPERTTEEVVAEEVIVETVKPEPVIIVEKPTLRARLLEWLDSRSEHDAPMPLGEMAEMFGTNRKTMNNTILVVAKKLPQPRADKLRASVLKQVQPPTLKRTKPIEKPSVAPVEASVGDWITEVRQCLRKTLSALPAPHKRQEWRDTLVEIERLFGELGIAENHRSRTDLREIGAWLTQD